MKLADRESELARAENDMKALYQELEEKTKRYEREITELKGKIIPTVNLNRVEEMYNHIAELVQMKLDLEISNRKLRDESFELSLKCDFLETQREVVEKLKRDLASRNVDDLQEQLIQYS
jgi:hypothetical protein